MLARLWRKSEVEAEVLPQPLLAPLSATVSVTLKLSVVRDHRLQTMSCDVMRSNAASVVAFVVSTPRSRPWLWFTLAPFCSSSPKSVLIILAASSLALTSSASTAATCVAGRVGNRATGPRLHASSARSPIGKTCARKESGSSATGYHVHVPIAYLSTKKWPDLWAIILS